MRRAQAPGLRGHASWKVRTAAILNKRGSTAASHQRKLLSLLPAIRLLFCPILSCGAVHPLEGSPSLLGVREAAHHYWRKGGVGQESQTSPLGGLLGKPKSM